MELYKNIIQKIKTFQGFSFTPIEIQANSFWGYGITLLSVQILTRKPGGINTSKGAALFFFTLNKSTDNQGLTWGLKAGILGWQGWIWQKTYIQPLPQCEQCGDLCQSGQFQVAEYSFCSESCKEWAYPS